MINKYIYSTIVIIIALIATYISLFFYFDNYIVIFPDFTASAYQPNGFYDYYSNHTKCCLTVPLSVDDNNMKTKFADNFNAKLLFTLLGFHTTSDIDVSNNPNILNNKTVIVLHNEYVTSQEYNAILNSSRIIFFYPNALYGNVVYNTHTTCYDCNIIGINTEKHFQTITLIRDIEHKVKAFGWMSDNTQYEKDNGKTRFCTNEQFTKVSHNIYMLNCWTQMPQQILGYILEINSLE